MDKHYVCIGGCGLVADAMIKCNSVGCWRARNPLGECFCEDFKHDDFHKQYGINNKESENSNITNSD